MISKKVFSIVALFATIAISFGFYFTYKVQEQDLRKAFEDTYRRDSKIYSDQLKEIEGFYELVMLNAVKAIAMEVGNKKVDLKLLAEKYNVSHLFLIGKDGNFTHSTNESPEEIPNLFSFSEDYRSLLHNKNGKFLTTPIILPFPEREPHKFLVVWDGHQFIEVGVRIKDIAETISKMLNLDSAISHVELTISGEAYQIESDANSKTKNTNQFFITKQTINISNPNYVQSDSIGSHSYELKFFVSRVKLHQEISALKKKFFINLGYTLLILAVLAGILIYLLKKKLAHITNQLKVLTKNESFDTEISSTSSNNELSGLVGAINGLLTQYRDTSQRVIKEEKVITINNLTAQVAHDIRSPLEALKSSRRELSVLGEEDRLKINTAISRIEEIAYSLLKMKKNQESNFQTASLLSCLDQILIEKRLQHREHPNFQIELNAEREFFGTFVKINPDSLKRILSNLIANSIEAQPHHSLVKIKLKKLENRIAIEILDHGEGFSQKYLEEKLFEKSYTTKSQGNGLGLWNAKKEIGAVGGNIAISNWGDSSEVGGARVVLTLDMAKTPSWHIRSIDLTNYKTIIILDDDKSIHKVWENRFACYDIELKHFYSGETLISNLEKLPPRTLLLSDYELLGEEVTGIDCIKKLKAEKDSILVTARNEEKELIQRAKQEGLIVLPKCLALEVPIVKRKNDESLILIDDERLNHLTWKKEAERSGKKLASFYSIEEFMGRAQDFNKEIPVYLDSCLGDNIKGEVEGEQIAKAGFTQIYISTGFQKVEIDQPAWVLGVVDKHFPLGDMTQS